MIQWAEMPLCILAINKHIHSILILLQINKSTIYKPIYDNVQMHEYKYKALPLTSTLLNFTVGRIIKNINQLT